MIKLALKNIWNRRGRYGWLFVELTAVAALSWVVLDSLVVYTWQYSRPQGYDDHLLVMMNTEVLDRRDPGVMPDRWDTTTDFYSILAEVRSLPEVDKATPVFSNLTFGTQGSGTFTMQTPDGKHVSTTDLYRVPGQDFFATYGITATDGSERSMAHLDTLTGLVNSGGMYEVLYPGENPFDVQEKKRREQAKIWGDSDPELSALGADAKPSPILPGRFYSIRCCEPGSKTDAIVMRLHPGVDRSRFVSKLLGRMDEFRRGNVRVTMVRGYDQIAAELEDRTNGRERRMNGIFTIFFMLNVCLGVTGTFWMMTRKRAREVGVHRAFGATPAGIRGMLLLEGVVLTVVTWVLGCAAYLWHALREGLSLGYADANTWDDTWVQNFWLHYAVVSGIILLLMLLAVAIGVAGPGWKLSRVRPVDALRSE